MAGAEGIEWVLDCETGEIHQDLVSICSRRLRTDSETGESVVTWYSSPNVTLEAVQVKNPKVSNKGSCIEKTVVQNSQNVSPIVFMLPTLIFCPAWASILCVIFEACVHIWSHKRNRIKKEGELVYRSPLHLITSEFCATCRSEMWMLKISKIQDLRTQRRNMVHAGYVRHVVH